MAAGSPDVNGWTVLQCDVLKGTGASGDPYQLGVITRPLEVQNCPTAAIGAIDDFFSFTLPQHPGTGSYAGASSQVDIDNVDGQIQPTLWTTQGSGLDCPGVNDKTPVLCGAGYWWDNDTYNANCTLLHFWGAGTYILEEGRNVYKDIGKLTYTLWVNPNYAGASPALAPPGSYLALSFGVTTSPWLSATAIRVNRPGGRLVWLRRAGACRR
jgi:hypothetical protein